MNHETIVELDVLLEFRDYLKANYWFMFRKLRFFLLLVLIGCLVYPLLGLTGATSQDPSDNNWGLIIPWVLIAFILGATYLNTKKHMASNKSLSETMHYVFSEDGIAVNAPSLSSHTTWKNIYEARETKSNFMIFLSNTSMYIVPKRCFHTVEQVASFKRLLGSQLGSKAKWKHEILSNPAIL